MNLNDCYNEYSEMIRRAPNILYASQTTIVPLSDMARDIIISIDNRELDELIVDYLLAEKWDTELISHGKIIVTPLALACFLTKRTAFRILLRNSSLSKPMRTHFSNLSLIMFYDSKRLVPNLSYFIDALASTWRQYCSVYVFDYALQESIWLFDTPEASAFLVYCGARMSRVRFGLPMPLSKRYNEGVPISPKSWWIKFEQNPEHYIRKFKCAKRIDAALAASDSILGSHAWLLQWREILFILAMIFAPLNFDTNIVIAIYDQYQPISATIASLTLVKRCVVERVIKQYEDKQLLRNF